MVREPELDTEILVAFRMILKAQHNSGYVSFGPSYVGRLDQGTQGSISDWAATCESPKRRRAHCERGCRQPDHTKILADHQHAKPTILKLT